MRAWTLGRISSSGVGDTSIDGDKAKANPSTSETSTNRGSGKGVFMAYHYGTIFSPCKRDDGEAECSTQLYLNVEKVCVCVCVCVCGGGEVESV